MSANRRNQVRGGILIAAAIMIAIGIWTGDVNTVFQKAIRVCLECIGLG